jgi:hypothetical protein
MSTGVSRGDELATAHRGRDRDGGDAHPPPARRRGRRWLLVVALLGMSLLLFTDRGQALTAPMVVKLRFAAPKIFGDGEYEFLRTLNGRPVAFSSCQPVRVVINETLRPEGAEGLIEEAVGEAARASGLTISIVGRTDEEPSSEREVIQARYGAGYAPVLIAWTTPEVMPELAGDIVGLGSSTVRTEGSLDRTYLASGQVTLDAPDADRRLRNGLSDAVRATILHELGHVLGLAHVDSANELMSEDPSLLDHYAPGDLAGLARLGRGPCI